MKDFLFDSINSFRYERKFRVSGAGAAEVEAMLMRHPAMFREIYHDRTVNNIYFDSFDYRHFFDNVNGISRRLKIRVRWYGELFGAVKKPALELKLKHNQHVGKLIYPLGAFRLDGKFSVGAMRVVFGRAALPDIVSMHLADADFSMLNSYRRKYFLSADRGFRVTIDRDIAVYGLSPRANSFTHVSRDENVIMEMKYNQSGEADADTVTGHLPFRMTRSSKYADGLMRLHGEV